MKNFFKLFGIVATVAMIGIGLAGCDNGNTNTEDPPPAGYGKITVTNDTSSTITGIWIGHYQSPSGGLVGYMALVGGFDGGGSRTPVSVSIGPGATYTSPLVDYKYDSNSHSAGYNVIVIGYVGTDTYSSTVTAAGYDYPTTLAFKASEFTPYP